MQERTRLEINLKIMTIFTLFIFVLLVSLLGFWTFYPYHPIETGPNPYPVIYPANKVVAQGEYLTYEFNYNKTSDILPTVQRQFVDGIIFNVAGTQTPTVTEQGNGTARVQIEIPETLPPGKYHIRTVAIYQMNPIRTFQHTNVTEDFEVISGRHTDAEQDTVVPNSEGR